MAFKADLTDKVREFVQQVWADIPDGHAVPAPEDLTFGNTGRRLTACTLYADICASTALVDGTADTQAAEYYKAYLYCAAKVIKRNGGEITAYDGDRVMAIFLQESKEDRAVGAALELSYALDEVINPEFFGLYKEQHRQLRHTVGIDVGTVLVSKTGVRIDSDLVWVGPAANYAAKLNSFEGLDSDYPIRVTSEVFGVLSERSLVGSLGEPMWEGPYRNVGHRLHYRTRFRRSFD